MPEHAFPGPDFPGPLPVRISLPDGWRPLKLPSVAMAFIDGASPVGVPTNLVVLVARIGGSPTLDDLAAAVRDQLPGRQTRTVATDAPRVAGNQAIRTVVSVEAPSVKLVQAQTVLAMPSPVDGLVEVVQVHLTCRADLWPTQERVLNAALASLAIG